MVVIIEPNYKQTQDADAFPVPRLKAKLTFHETCDEALLLLVYKLVYVVCPPSTVCTQTIHTVTDRIKLLGAFVELP